MLRLEKLKTKVNDTTIKDIRIFFRLQKQNKAIKDRIIIYIRNLIEPGNIRNIFRFLKKVIKDKILEILEIYLSTKKKKIIINQQE